MKMTCVDIGHSRKKIVHQETSLFDRPVMMDWRMVLGRENGRCFHPRHAADETCDTENSVRLNLNDPSIFLHQDTKSKAVGDRITEKVEYVGRGLWVSGFYSRLRLPPSVTGAQG